VKTSITGDEMFTPIGSPEAKLTIYFDDEPIHAREGETVAACLLRAGALHFRTTPVSGSKRLPYCMIGHCFDCLVEVVGIGTRQACLSQVEDGMRVYPHDGVSIIVGGFE
jgi:hypothetical protein